MLIGDRGSPIFVHLICATPMTALTILWDSFILFYFILFDAHFTQFQLMYITRSETIGNMIPRHQMKALTGIALPYITQVTVKTVRAVV